MLPTPATVLFGVAILSGVLLCGLGGYAYWRWDEPGIGPFAVSTVLLGLFGIIGVGVALQGGPPATDGPPSAYWDIALSGWIIAVVPWALFALLYTGRFTRLRPRAVVAASLPLIAVPLVFLPQVFEVTAPSVLTQLLGTFTLVYAIGLAALGSYLLLRTNYEYGHLSTVQGVLLAVTFVAPLLLLNLIGAASLDAEAAYGIYALAFAVPAVTLGIAVLGTGLFESTPAAGAIGERAIARETGDLVFVLDREERVIKINETVVETLEVRRTDALGKPFESVVEPSFERLRDSETVELGTAAGTRKFDAQVTAFTDQHDRRLGWLLSLRDVTERELRKQRLEVLNRVLRHNLRNRVDVIKGNAEAVADRSDEAFAGSILESADELASVSAKARSIDQLVSRPSRPTEGDLAAVVETVVDQDAAVDVTVDCPTSAPLVTDWEALRVALESAVENALEYAEGSVAVTVDPVASGYEVVVADDGPGIPASELASIDAETETPLQHGTGLGLWRLKWGVTKLNGDLAFDVEDGTTVTMRIPSRDSTGAESESTSESMSESTSEWESDPRSGPSFGDKPGA